MPCRPAWTRSATRKTRKPETGPRVPNDRESTWTGRCGILSALKHYRFIDYATQGYNFLVGLLVLAFHGNEVAYWHWILAAHGFLAVLLHGLIVSEARFQGGATLRFLRSYYPILLYVGFYRETGALNQMFFQGYLDPVFIHADELLFGFQPSLTFMERFPYLAISELFYAAYFSYYLMIAGIGLALYLRDERQFNHFISIVSVVFYCCYLTYIFLPVMGPRLFSPELFRQFNVSLLYALPADLVNLSAPQFPPTIGRGLFHRLILFIYQHFESPGAAFPSSHVVIAVTTLYFTWIYLPRLRPWHLAAVVGLCASTVYCRYHYVVDVLAGLVAAAILIPFWNRLYAKLALAHPVIAVPSAPPQPPDALGGSNPTPVT
jgi:membrane-associated phospholipid phosphatase